MFGPAGQGEEDEEVTGRTLVQMEMCSDLHDGGRGRTDCAHTGAANPYFTANRYTTARTGTTGQCNS